MADDYKPVAPADVADDNPRVVTEHLRALQREMRDGFESIANNLLPAINRINDALADIAVRLNRLEHDRDDINQRVRLLEQGAKKRLRRK